MRRTVSLWALVILAVLVAGCQPTTPTSPSAPTPTPEAVSLDTPLPAPTPTTEAASPEPPLPAPTPTTEVASPEPPRPAPTPTAEGASPEPPLSTPPWPSPAFAPVPGLKIAFHTNRDGNYEIYVMGADGSNPVNLTNHPAEDHSPAWSPDGAHLAFVSDRDGNSELYLMAVQLGLESVHSDLIRLTRTEGDESHPAWSPDASRLAFARPGQQGVQIYVMSVPEGAAVDESGMTRLTDIAAGNTDPAWAPDSPSGGGRIAFSSEPNHYSSSLQIVQLDGSVTRLTSGGSYHDFHPTWSPGSDYIAYASEQLGHLKFEIFVIPVPRETGGAYPQSVQLTDSGGSAWRPAWSPDGTRIAFSAKNGDDNRDIYVMSIPEGSSAGDGRPLRLTDHPAVDDCPSWSPHP